MEIQNIYARARFQAALEQGIEQGRLEHSKATLMKLLQLKFGAEAAESVGGRLDEANLETLERWTERFVTADTLDEIFVGPDSGA